LQILHGDMWSAWDSANLFLITTNAIVTKDGRLVMGRGIAEQARERFPGIDKTFGSMIESGTRYGLFVSPDWPKEKLGAFQVKMHYRDNASLELIEYSTACLNNWCNQHPEAKVHLNFPGIGYRKLSAAGSPS
jgi:hypothetical protein